MFSDTLVVGARTGVPGAPRLGILVVRALHKGRATLDRLACTSEAPCASPDDAYDDVLSDARQSLTTWRPPAPGSGLAFSESVPRRLARTPGSGAARRDHLAIVICGVRRRPPRGYRVVWQAPGDPCGEGSHPLGGLRRTLDQPTSAELLGSLEPKSAGMAGRGSSGRATPLQGTV